MERGVPERKITVIPNWCNEDVSQTGPADEEAARSNGKHCGEQEARAIIRHQWAVVFDDRIKPVQEWILPRIL